MHSEIIKIAVVTIGALAGLFFLAFVGDRVFAFWRGKIIRRSPVKVRQTALSCAFWFLVFAAGVYFSLFSSSFTAALSLKTRSLWEHYFLLTGVAVVVMVILGFSGWVTFSARLVVDGIDWFLKKKKPELFFEQKAIEPPPDDLKRWNWGAFFMTWVVATILFRPLIEGFCNSIGNAALFFLPVAFVYVLITAAFSVLLGIKGNASIWKSREWNTIDDFHQSQRRTALIGGALFLIFVGGNFFHIFLSGLFTRFPVYQDATAMIRNNREALERLGEPVRVYLPFDFHSKRDFTTFNYRVSGPQGSGLVTVSATKNNNVFRYQRVEFETDGPSKKKILIFP